MSSSAESTLSFASKAGALFTPDEIRDLMAVEFERSKRYSYPIACMVIGVDRLTSLETYYGRSAIELVLERIVELIQNATRSSDFLGCRMDDRILAVFPHTTAKVGAALAQRILEGARRLDVVADQKALRVSLSIGLSHNQHDTPISFPTLVRVAEDGMSVADSGGGDRFVETELYQLYERQLTGEDPEESEAVAAVTEVQATEEFEARARSMAEEILSQALARMGQPMPEAAAEPVLDEELLEQRLAEREVELLREASEHAKDLESKEAEYRLEIENLQRRVAKLSKSLSKTEGELKRVVQLKDMDQGLSSIYREVQGLDMADDNAEAKKEMMSAIFEANMLMQGKKSG